MEFDKHNKNSHAIKKDAVAKLLQSFDEKFQIVIFSEIEQRIGKGSFGGCYLGISRSKHSESNINQHQIVVVKEILKNQRDSNQEILYKREVETLSKATSKSQYNKNLVRCYPYTFASDTHYYIVMEYCQNGSLDRLMQKRQSEGRWFNFVEVLKIFADLMRGYSCLKKIEILHEDIKTANIFIRDKNFKIGDFGLSFIMNRKDEFLGRGGTPSYNAIEKYKNSSELNHKSDIYAIGIILFRLMYQIHPYYEEQELKKFEQFQIQKLAELQKQMNQQQQKHSGKAVLNTVHLKPNKKLEYSKQQLFIKFYDSRKLKTRGSVVERQPKGLEIPINQELYESFCELIKKMIEKDNSKRASFEVVHNFISKYKVEELVNEVQAYDQQRHKNYKFKPFLFEDLSQNFDSGISLPCDFDDIGDQIYFEQEINVHAKRAEIQSSIISASKYRTMLTFRVEHIKQTIEYINRFTRVLMEVKENLTQLDLAEEVYDESKYDCEQELNRYEEKKVTLEFVLEKFLLSIVKHYSEEMNQLVLELNENELKAFYKNDIDCLLRITRANKNYLENELFIMEGDFDLEGNFADITKTISKYLQQLSCLDKKNCVLTWYYIQILKFVENVTEFKDQHSGIAEISSRFNALVQQWESFDQGLSKKSSSVSKEELNKVNMKTLSEKGIQVIVECEW